MDEERFADVLVNRGYTCPNYVVYPQRDIIQPANNVLFTGSRSLFYGVYYYRAMEFMNPVDIDSDLLEHRLAYGDLEDNGLEELDLTQYAHSNA